MYNDTIAAIATALNESGIGIVRLSGPEAIKITDEIFVNSSGQRTFSNYESHTIHYGFIMDGDSKIDEVMVSLMKGPKSYTKEDTVEINCHGGVLMVRRILELVLSKGARIAEPGEFTKRAFLNGRIDLTEAEAVMDVIGAGSKHAMEIGMKQLSGSLFNSISEIRKKLIYEIAFIESALDDPEHISLEGYPKRLKAILDGELSSIGNLIDSYDDGRLIKEGIKTVILGKPNAGKSSLLNALVGEERAIVTDIAGTTRDTLEENIRLSGISLNLIDTAGIRKTEDVVEKIGVEKAYDSSKDADLIIYVVDSSKPLDDSDEEIIEIIKKKKAVVLLNKSDLNTIVDEETLKGKIPSGCPIIKTSMTLNEGLDLFEKTLENLFFKGELKTDREVYITSLRHKAALEEARRSLNMVLDSLSNDMPEDFLSIDLMSAYSSLGRIIGEEVDDDLVNEIFSKFCMGK
ncbi:MAG: tRNA uridine-5-carboxymethylaminomethyl(34) synthesis GTPase MnmE [Lachnospiraceae bacterium]|nr:tRNA uridine-5-carboxymethylaminomethyl(34) synthesis GTPase MnmE [Lachnospiraceae bacterium]